MLENQQHENVQKLIETKLMALASSTTFKDLEVKILRL